MGSMRPFAPYLLTGFLLVAAFSPSPVGVLSLIAYVPLLLVLTTDAVTMSTAKRRWALYLTFAVFHIGTNWWISSWQERTDPYLFASGLALCVFHPFFLMAPWAVVGAIARRSRRFALVLAPIVVTAFEWAHGQTDASYPWLTTGYMVVGNDLAQLAEWVGVYGLTFMILCVNVAVSVAWMGWRRYPRRSRVVATSITLFVGIWWTLGYTLREGASLAFRKGGGTSVALVQPDEDPWEKWSDPRIQVRRHISMVDSVRASGKRVDLVVWSETAIPFPIRDARYSPEWESLRTWIDTSGISLLTGYSDFYVYPTGTAPPSARTSTLDLTTRFDAFNAAMLIEPGRSDIPVHRKTMLTPVAERLPFADQLTFAMSWFEWGVGISSWGKGAVREPLPSRHSPQIGVIICIESIYPEVALDLVRNGANVLCVITNDAWYNGTPGPRQHYDIARMRAIEQRKTLLRCANSGVTGVILPNGASAAEIPALEPGVLTLPVYTNEERTVFSRIGNLPAQIFAVCTAGILLTLIVLRTRERRRSS